MDKTGNFALEHAGNTGRMSTTPVSVFDKEKVANDQLDLHRRKATNWYVITGGPGSGKTTTINILKARGYKTTIEHARHYLDTQLIKGKTVEEVRSNQQLFQLGVLDMQIDQEASIAPNDLVFLDRAIPDALAYYRFLHLDVDQRLTDALHSVSYKKVFILDCLPLVQDYARREDEAAQKKIHALLVEVYSSLQFPVIRVPVLPPEERVDLLLKNL
jgi:predicted ATPase